MWCADGDRKGFRVKRKRSGKRRKLDKSGSWKWPHYKENDGSDNLAERFAYCVKFGCTRWDI